MIKHNFNELDIKLLLLLINKQSISIKDLIKEFPSSESLIKKNLTKINNTLLSLGYPSLRLKRGIYGILPTYVSSIKKLINYSFKNSPEERIFYILFKLITEKKIILSKETINLNCTRKTLQSDLKEGKNILKRFNISVESLHSKYILAKGNQINFYKLLLILFYKILINKDVPFYKNFYNKYFPENKYVIYKKFCEKIESVLEFSLGYNIFNKIFAIFAIYENFNSCLPNIICKKDPIFYKLLNLNISLITKNINFLKEIIDQVDSKNYDILPLNSYIFKFIITFESIFFQLNSENKMVIYNILNEATEDSLLNSTELLTYTSNNTENFTNFNKIIYNMLTFSNISISLNYFHKLIFYLKSLVQYEDNLIYKYNKKILILDNSLTFWMGKIIKEKLLKNYDFDYIHLISSFSTSFSLEDYDLIFKIDIKELPKLFSKKNVIQLDLEYILQENNYFNQFNFKEL